MKASAEVLDFLGLLDAGAAPIDLRVPVLLLDLQQLVADERPAAALVLEQRVDLARSLALLGELVLDDEDLEARQSIQLQLEDGVGLLGVQLEALDDLLGRVGLAVGLANEADDLVECVEDLLEALEDVDALLQLRELVLEARGHHVQAEVEEVPEDLLQVEPLGAADLGVLGRHQAGQVDREGGLERGVLEQVRHHEVLVGARLQLQLDADVVGGEIPDVHQVRHLAAEHDVANLLDELRLVDGVRHARDVEQLAAARRRPALPGAADADRARAGAIDLLQLGRRIENVPASREVRPLHPAAELNRRQIRIVEQLDEGRAHLVEVVRRDVRGHAHGDARRAVHQQVRDAGGQHHRLLLRAVVAGPEMDGLLLDLEEHFVRQPRQPAFGVAHGRGRVAVERPEVAGAVDQRIAQREGLRHPHERLVDRRVAVGVVVAHHVAHDLGALAVLRGSRQVLLPHRVENAALHGLQSVTHVRQRARRDHRQRVIQVSRLCGLVQRDRGRSIARRRRGCSSPRWRGGGWRAALGAAGVVVVVEKGGFCRTFGHW